jgi:hypothetical protein
VEGLVALDLEGQLDCTTGLSVTATPRSNLSTFVEGSVNLRIIQFGVSTTLNLIDVQLPANANIRWLQGDGCANWGTSINRIGRSLGGSVNLFTIVRFLFFRERFDLNIANWNGITWSNNPLVPAQNGQICPT